MPLREADQIADLVMAAIKQAVGPLEARLAALEARPILAGRDGQPGRDGLPGPAGERGPQGEKGLDGKDGKDGAAGLDGAPGQDGLHGKDGRDGIDGKDGAPGVQGQKGMDGRDGLDGKDGKDGVTLTNVDVQHAEYDEERRVITWRINDRVTVETPAPMEMPRYRGVWKDGTEYGAGDCVTWGGALWIAKTITTAKPNLPTEDSRAWVLAVKSGRDGKTGPQGPKGDKGDKG